jgi:hypothetical protein
MLAEDVAVDVADQELIGALGSSAGTLDGGRAAYQRPDLRVSQLGSRPQGGEQPVLRFTDQVGVFVAVSPRVPVDKRARTR